MTEHDQWLKDNIDRIGQAVTLPPEPTPQQRDSWMAPAASSAASSACGPLQCGARFLKTHAGWTSSLGLAAAAAVAAGVFLVNLPRVQAGTIFQELRHLLANHRLSWVSYEKLASDGPQMHFQMDLQGYVQHGEAGEPARYCMDTKFSSGNMSFKLGGTTLQWDLTGVVVEEFLAQSPQGSWAYFRFLELPDEFWKRNPSAWLLAPVVR